MRRHSVAVTKGYQLQSRSLAAKEGDAPGGRLLGEAGPVEDTSGRRVVHQEVAYSGRPGLWLMHRKVAYREAGPQKEEVEGHQT